MGRWGVTAGVVLLSATTIAACANGSQPHTQAPPSSATPSATTSPTGSIDPNAQPAVDAYLSFRTAATEALKDPKTASTGKDKASDVSPYAFDPMRAQYTTYVANLAYQQVAFRGTPPTPRVRVQSTDLSAKPYPKVTLSDCETPAPTWEEYVIKTGKVVPAANGKVPPPYRLTVEMIYFQGHWGITTSSADKSSTCTA